MSDYTIDGNLLTLKTKDVTDIIILDTECITWNFIRKKDHVLHLIFASCLGGVFEPEKRRFFLYHPYESSEGMRWKWSVFEEVAP